MSGYKRTGKFQKKNPYKDRKEYKSDEIKKSLTHRARLRKNYFKLMEKEGLPIDKNEDENEAESENDNKSESRGNTRREYKKPDSKKPMNFAERAKLAKERKDLNRREKLESIKNRREVMAQRSKEREFKKERLSKKSRTGQPLMGPRINNLLDKIKSEMK
ncbi:rRNA-processing protein Fyv7p [[Candida] railenensis]|uniref:rRNA-processing protein FYV7 n=1 Tax=[Candida] railenensis TaxID=45579 RepID=A0A9P0VYH6_9ASCO|nr:rRNA-processing protein Fyv7p [[Candida] railenensis]